MTPTRPPAAAGWLSRRSRSASGPTSAAGLGSPTSSTGSTTPRRRTARAELTAVLKTRTRDEWVAELAPADTCVAPVLAPAEAAAAPQFTERGAVVTAETATGDDSFRQLAPLLAGAPRATSYDLPDRTRTDTDAVLGDAGFDPDEIAHLRADGVIG